MLDLLGGTGDRHMSQDTQRNQMSRTRVVYAMPGMEAVAVRRDEPYRVTETGALTMDLYHPPDSKAAAPTTRSHVRDRILGFRR